jgi:predicted nucleotidyltransferase
MPDKKIIEKILSVMNNYPEIHIVILFGSAVKNRLRPDSDIDIAVAGSRTLLSDQKYDMLLSLSEALAREVDIVDLQAVAGSILQQALCKGVIIKKTSPPILAELIKKMWYNQSDMMPYTRRILKARCERFIHG